MSHAKPRTNLFGRQLMVERVAAGWPITTGIRPGQPDGSQTRHENRKSRPAKQSGKRRRLTVVHTFPTDIPAEW